MMPAILALYLVCSPAAPWTPERAAAAVQQVEQALAWWEARTGDAAPRLAAPVIIETPTPYDRTSWMGTEPGIYLVARQDGDPVLASGRSGWARPYGLRLVALETPGRGGGSLAALVAHEWGHARYGLPDIEARDDIMGPGYPRAYDAGRVGCTSLAGLGRPCVRLPLLQGVL